MEARYMCEGKLQMKGVTLVVSHVEQAIEKSRNFVKNLINYK